MAGNIKNPNHILGPGIIKEKNPLARMKEFFAQLSTLWCIPLLDFMIGMFILLMIWGTPYYASSIAIITSAYISKISSYGVPLI